MAVPIEGEAAERLGRVWQALRGVMVPRPGDIPHVSLHVADEYEIDQADSALRSLARSQSRFTVHTAGFGLFSGSKPVLHLSVTRAPQLTALYRAVAQEVGRFATDADPNFAPTRWVPHITLARERLPSDTVAAAAARLAEIDLALDLPVAALAFIEDLGEGQRMLHRHTLTG